MRRFQRMLSASKIASSSVSWFVAGHDGEPPTPEPVEEATDTASHDDR